MAKFTVKSGGRGRPLTIDSDKLLTQLQLAYRPAMRNLAQIRKGSSGVRDAALLGTQTSVPEWWQTTLTLAEQAQSGALSYEAAKYVRENIRAIQRLASRQERSRAQALSDILYKDYLRDLEYQMRGANKESRKWYEATKAKIQKLSKRERQEYFTSRAYESPKAFGRNRYEKIRAWAKKNTGKATMSYSEAYAYLLYRRAADGLENSNDKFDLFGG